jgi:hypothetical protein
LKKTLSIITTLALLAPVCALHAANTSVNCDKKSLQGEIDKMNRLDVNTVSVSGNCDEDIVVSGFADLTISGVNGASITATGNESGDKSGLSVRNGSKVRVESLTINGGGLGLECTERSKCTLRDVSTQGGAGGVAAQDQSAIDILGVSNILNSTGSGVAAYGASSINMRPAWLSGFVPDEPGSLISGHVTGVWVQDGSFFRSDNLTVSGNDQGIFAQRNATLKVISNGDPAGPLVGEVSNSASNGININRGSTAQIITVVKDNAGWGVVVGALSFGQIFSEFSGNGGSILCTHVTAVTADDQGPGGASTCP